MSIKLVPYSPVFDSAIQQLESSIVQGKGVQLTILKNHFLDRSIVYNKFFGCLGIDENGLPISTSVAAQTSMIVNEELFDAGFGYDVKVHPAYRNKGIGRQMAKFLYKQFFNVQGLTRNFITLKLSNVAVIRLVSKAISNIWLYPFVYLTMPTSSRVKDPVTVKGKKQLLSVALFPDENLSASYYTSFSSGLACFHTNNMYRLKIQKISFLFRQALLILKRIWPQKHRLLPQENEILEFVTLYNHNGNNIKHINEVLAHLENQGRKYLLVCCRKNDCIYKMLKKQSINTYSYYILSDFPLRDEDEVTIDVRCL